MRILEVINGVSIHSTLWVEALYKKGYDVYVFFPDEEYKMGSLIPKERIFYSSFLKYRYKNKLFRYLNWGFELYKIYKKIKPDIIHIQLEQYSMIFFVMDIIRKFMLDFKEVKLVFSLMGAQTYYDMHLAKYKSFMFKYAIKKSKFVTYDSMKMESFLRDFLKEDFKEEKMHEIFWGVDTKNLDKVLYRDKYNLREKFKIDKNKFIVLSIRNSLPNYNLKIIAQTAKLLEDRDDIEFIFIGRGDFKEVKTITKNLGNVRVFGLLRGEDYFNIIYSSDVVVSIPTFDSISLSVLESLYLSKPVISSKIEDLEEFLLDNEVIFLDKLTPNNLKEKILYIKDNYNKLSKNLNNWRKTFREKIDFYENLEKLEELFKQILKS